MRTRFFSKLIFYLSFVFLLTSVSFAANPGDATNDGKITQADVTAIINHTLGGPTPPGNPDCNNDLSVNIQVCYVSKER